MTHTLRHGDTLFRDTALHKHTLRATRALARTFRVPNPMGIDTGGVDGGVGGEAATSGVAAAARMVVVVRSVVVVAREAASVVKVAAATTPLSGCAIPPPLLHEPMATNMVNHASESTWHLL
jgi:hypothetical protein